MKKTVAVLLALSCVCMSVFAGFEYELDLFSFDPLYKEYKADKNSANMQFNYIYNFAGFPEYIFQDSKSHNTGYTPEVFPVPGQRMVPWMGQLKVGEQLGLFRNTFRFDSFLSPISFDLSAQGMINLLFEGPMADMIGYDGVYFIGATASVADMVSMRFGVHHYCNHYGDALMKRVDPALMPKFGYSYKYVRMDGLAIGLSVEPMKGIRLYGEYNWIPKNVESWRPIIFRPSYLDIAKKDQYSTEYPDEYKARIINCGIELSYPIFPKLGNTTIAYDLHLYEEGKIVYKDKNGMPVPTEDLIYYDPDRPWIMEHSVVLSQDVSDVCSFEVGYHYGRSPFNALFYIEDASWIYFGATFNPDVTVNVVDTGR